LADFKNLAHFLRDSIVEAKLESPYWQLSTPKVKLTGKSQSLFYQPNGSLAVIEGKVSDAGSAAPLANALAEVFGVTDTTDSSGKFSLNMPPVHQRENYSLTVSLAGFHSKTVFHNPASGRADIRLERNSTQ
jgi:hypothetical protein